MLPIHPESCSKVPLHSRLLPRHYVLYPRLPGPPMIYALLLSHSRLTPRDSEWFDRQPLDSDLWAELLRYSDVSPKIPLDPESYSKLTLHSRLLPRHSVFTLGDLNLLIFIQSYVYILNCYHDILGSTLVHPDLLMDTRCYFAIRGSYQEIQSFAMEKLGIWICRRSFQTSSGFAYDICTSGAVLESYL